MNCGVGQTSNGGERRSDIASRAARYSVGRATRSRRPLEDPTTIGGRRDFMRQPPSAARVGVPVPQTSAVTSLPVNGWATCHGLRPRALDAAGRRC
jgi:hypothetical protein